MDIPHLHRQSGKHPNQQAVEETLYLHAWLPTLEWFLVETWEMPPKKDAVRCIKDNEEIITGIKLGNLEVFKKDIGEFSFNDAMLECAKIGGGWRVPTKEELNQLFENKETIGHFTDGFYCSSTNADDEATGCAWGQRFSDGRPNIYSRSHKTFVRPVRGI